jgi:uncharacterized protein YecT (DUF1311 family)
MKKRILTLSILIFAPPLLAAPLYVQKTIDECIEIGIKNEVQSSRCLDSVKELANRELQTWVNHHAFNLEDQISTTGRSSALKMFRRSQESFISFRENECRWQYLAISPEKNAGVTYKKCFILLTKSRIEQLSKIP